MRLLQQLRENFAPLGVSLSSVAIVLAMRSFGWLAPSELWAYDRLYRPKDILCDSPIILVIFNERDVQKYGHPIDGLTMSALLDKLQASQPAAIAIDIFRDLPVEPGHVRLLRHLQTANVIAIERVGEPPILPPPGATRVGSADGVLDDSGAIRRALFALGRPTKPSLGLLAAALYLNGTTNDSWQQLANLAKPYELTPNDGPYHDADTKGHQLLLHWKECQFATHSFTDILESSTTIAPGKIIFIGQDSESVKDSYVTPIGTIPGVRYHGNVAAQFLDLASNEGTPVRLPNELAIAVGLWAISLTQTGITLRARSRQAAIIGFSILVSLAVLLAMSVLSYVSFMAFALWLPFIPALAIVVINLFGCTNYLYLCRLAQKNEQLTEIIDGQISELIENQNFVNSAVIIDGVMHEASIPINDTLAELNALKSYLIGKVDGESKIDDGSEEPTVTQDFLEILEDLASIEENIKLIQKTTQFVRLLDKDYEVEPPQNSSTKVCDTIESLCNYARKSSINLYKNIEISCSCPKNLFVALDEGRLTRILTNLIVNSIEELKSIRTDDFQPKITVSAEMIQDWCEIRVSDNGPGIPRDIQDTAFSPYVTSKKNGRRRGKGLWIAKLITEAVGGTLTYSKLEYEGCTFLLRLPLCNNAR